MAYLSLLTLLCLSLLLVMSSEGIMLRSRRSRMMRQNSGPRKCVIIKPRREEGEAALQKATPRDPDGWTVERVSCNPTTVKGLSEDCSSKIGNRKDIDLLVFDVFNLKELHEVQLRLAFAERPQIEFFVHYNDVFNEQTGEGEVLDIGKLLRNGYSEKFRKFVEFSREGKPKVSYFGEINWEIKKETDLKYKEIGGKKYTTLDSFVGTIWKRSAGLILDGIIPPKSNMHRSMLIKDLQIPENTEGTFKPLEGWTTAPFNFEHNFKNDKELRITSKKKNYWVASE